MLPCLLERVHDVEVTHTCSVTLEGRCNREHLLLGGKMHHAVDGEEGGN